KQITGLDVFKDIFISYNRGMSLEFVWDLYMLLIDAQLEVWFDQNDIPLGVDFQSQIDQGIIKADNFIFVLSPGAVTSIYCLKEALLAVRLGKRIIPLLHEMPKEEDWEVMQRNVEKLKIHEEIYKHPIIDITVTTMKKLNWIFFREREDNFERSMQGLMELMRLHSDYVKLHTQLLANANEWQRHNKRIEYLLVGNERNDAEAWLNREFEKEQPPCQPSDIHAEYICESKKNGQNLMTDLFICYAQEDFEIREQIRVSLARYGITTWTHDKDIKKGVDYASAINEGIEKADNLLFFISPESVVSKYCLKELDYALKYRKRIIPLIIKKTDDATFPESIKSLQYINLTENVEERNYGQDVNLVRAELRNDNDYHQYHKMFLVQALKWERNEQNKSLLLRGYNLKQAESWLKIGQKRTIYKPTTLHEEFIQQSKISGAMLGTEVFISYSRANSDFARELNENLQLHGKTTWFDQESIASGADFAAEINQGIKNSDNFLFVISPRSIQSEYCADEVEYAHKLGKRFITLLYDEVNEDELHPELAKVQWIDFRPGEARYNTAIGELVRTLDTDLDHVRMHTRMLMRQMEWFQKNQDKSLLLLGSELRNAESWLANNAEKDPSPTNDQRMYILAGRQEVVRKRRIKSAVTGFVVTVVFLAGLAFIQYLSANEQRKIAERNAEQAQQQELLAEKNAGEARRQKVIAENERTIADSLRQIAEQNEDDANQQRDIAEEQKGIAEELKVVAEGHRNQAIYSEVSLRLGEVYRYRAENDGLSAVLESIIAGHQLRLADEIPPQLFDRTVEIVQKTITGAAEFNRLEGHAIGASGAQINESNNQIVTTDIKGTIRIWQANGNIHKTLSGHNGLITRFYFSPDSQWMVSAGKDEAIRIWDRSGQLEKQVDNAHKGVIWDVKISPDGQLIASSGVDNTIKLWALSGKAQQTLSGHMNGVTRVSFHPTANRLASASWDGTIRLWNIGDGSSQTIVDDPDEIFTNVAFSPDGKMMATVNTNFIIQFWQANIASDSNAKLLKTLSGHSADINAIAWNKNGSLLVSGGDDRTVKVWEKDGTLLTTLKGHTAPVNHVAFHPDGKTVASAANDRTVRLWRLDYILSPPEEIADLDQLLQHGCDWLEDYLESGAIDSNGGICGHTDLSQK
ncbi:MAG: TIR domain-containing protein, partial [Planctomycetes bacterium]|nr:TIR domain-containing protein [Planctomycetota bacterium]